MQDVEIEDFRGDAAALENMAHVAWRDEYGRDSYPNLYRPDYLDYLTRGLPDPQHSIAAYRGDEIVGFMTNLPRRMALDGKIYRAALSCLLVVRKEFFRQGLAQAMIQEGLKRNERFQYDFTLFYLETGHRSRRMFTKLASAGFPIERVKRMHVIARPLDLAAIQASEKVKTWEVMAMKLLGAHRPPKSADDPRVREATTADADAALALLGACQGRARLARVFEKEELCRELFHPPIARTLVFEKNGRIQGLLAYVTIDHVGRTTVPWAWINHLEWETLSFSERKSFLMSFLARVHEQGCAGVVEWSKNVYSTGALWAARFVPYPRQVDMMAWRFRDDVRLAGIRDVYEVQI